MIRTCSPTWTRADAFGVWEGAIDESEWVQSVDDARMPARRVVGWLPGGDAPEGTRRTRGLDLLKESLTFEDVSVSPGYAPLAIRIVLSMCSIVRSAGGIRCGRCGIVF